MEDIAAIRRRYNQIDDKLSELELWLQTAEQNGLDAQNLQNLNEFTEFINRDIKNQLRAEEDVLSHMRRQLGEHKSDIIRSAISEHDVLYGALDQLLYGIHVQSEPDILESAKSMLTHFPPHIEKIDAIASQAIH